MPLHAKSLLHLRPTYELVVSRMLLSLGQAVTTVGIPLFFIDLGMSDASFGIFMGFAALLAALTSLFSPPLLERYNQLRILILTTALSGVAFILLGFSGILLAITLVILHNIGVTLATNSQSILFKDSTRSKTEFRRDMGLMGSLLNLSWFIGPLLGGYVLSVSGTTGLFILAGILCVLSSVYISIQPFKARHKNRSIIDNNLRENIKNYIQNRTLRIAFFQRMGIMVWWGFIWTFMPIFMLENNYSVSQIGIFIALTQLPLFLLEFKTTFAAAKFSYRWIFIACYGILSLLTIFASISSNYDWILIVMIVASLSLAFLEPITDLFFFDNVSLIDEEKTYPLYAISSLAGSALVKISVGATLLLLPNSAAFGAMAIIMGFIAFNALGIKENNS